MSPTKSMYSKQIGMYFVLCYRVVQLGEYELVKMTVSQVTPKNKIKGVQCMNFDFVYINKTMIHLNLPNGSVVEISYKAKTLLNH